MTQQDHPARETTNNTSSGGVNPSDLPAGDSPVRPAEGDILDEPDNPQAPRPVSPMNADKDPREV